MKESGAVNSSGNIASDEQRPLPPSSGGAKNLNSNAQNHPVDNSDSANGGLTFVENSEAIA